VQATARVRVSVEYFAHIRITSDDGDTGVQIRVHSIPVNYRSYNGWGWNHTEANEALIKQIIARIEAGETIPGVEVDYE